MSAQTQHNIYLPFFSVFYKCVAGMKNNCKTNIQIKVKHEFLCYHEFKLFYSGFLQ